MEYGREGKGQIRVMRVKTASPILPLVNRLRASLRNAIDDVQRRQCPALLNDLADGLCAIVGVFGEFDDDHALGGAQCDDAAADTPLGNLGEGERAGVG